MWPFHPAMELSAMLRRTMVGLLFSGLALVLMALAARASEITEGAAPSALVIHDAAETLRDYCREEEGRLWLTLPGGARFELVESPFDSAIANSGSGAFHAFDPAVVRAAIDGVRFPLRGVTAEVFLLPYPRRTSLQSAAGPGVILLSPGVQPLSAEHQHAEVVHELGHVVQYARMPDRDLEAWARYRALRGITDTDRYHAAAPHAWRPHEIFAEDFRALFGDRLANYSGSIENATLIPPAEVAGLEDFMLELAESEIAAPTGLAASPNPARGPVTFQRAGGNPAPVDLYDAAGRRIATLHPTAASGAAHWSWDGRDRNGVPMPAGAFWARERGAQGPALRLAVLR
jgi:hypothetical protein